MFHANFEAASCAPRDLHLEVQEDEGEEEVEEERKNTRQRPDFLL